MNKLKLNNTAGFPLDTDVLAFMQEAYSVFNHLGNLAGNYAIISGCKITGNKVENGVVFIDGEVLPFKGGTLGTSVIIKNDIKKLPFEDGSLKPVEITKYVTFGTGSSAISWNKFKRLKDLQELEAEIKDNKKEDKELNKKLVALEKRLTEKLNKIVPKGLVAIWGRSANEIPEGWVECEDLRGRVPVGCDPYYDYVDNDDRTNYHLNQKGYTGGKREHQLTIHEMPKHKHDINYYDYNKNSTQGSALKTQYSNSKKFNSTRRPLFEDSKGGDKAHTNMQPYRVVEFIEFVGL